MAHVIRLVDFETTGMELPAEVCEVGYCDLTQQDDGSWQVGEPVSWLCGVAAMPPEVRAVHFITAAEVAGLAPFDPQAFVGDSDQCAALAAHNMAFEEQWLKVDGIMPAICTLKAALRVWPEAPAHSNSVLRCWLEDQGKIVLDFDKAMPPHRAGPDAYVTAHILLAMLKLTTAAQMVAWTKQPLRFDRWGFGKHIGELLVDTPTDYLDWAIRTLDEDVKWNCRRELDRRAGR